MVTERRRGQALRSLGPPASEEAPRELVPPKYVTPPVNQDELHLVESRSGLAACLGLGVTLPVWQPGHQRCPWPSLNGAVR